MNGRSNLTTVIREIFFCLMAVSQAVRNEADVRLKDWMRPCPTCDQKCHMKWSPPVNKGNGSVILIGHHGPQKLKLRWPIRQPQRRRSIWFSSFADVHSSSENVHICITVVKRPCLWWYCMNVIRSLRPRIVSTYWGPDKMKYFDLLRRQKSSNSVVSWPDCDCIVWCSAAHLVQTSNRSEN